ncbi:MAG TPA: glycoside hydrolase family 3 N-terminal domain-containing protein [Devosia sp.]|nr:glycoside hydrolase family 3 N-terminal domain-containing protein [Devosia sp.]
MLKLAALLTAIVFTSPALASPSLEQMAGQMVLVGFKGASVDDASIKALTDEIRQGQIGGIMYLKANVKSLAAVKAMNAAFTAASPPGLPVLITLDQEGGAVQRLTSSVGFPEMPNARDVAKTDSPADAETLYGRTAEALKGYGFNVNFGPVVDLDVNPTNPIIGHYGRSFSADPDKVIAYAEAFIDAHHKAGLITSLKHFPGHGSSTSDSHKGFVDISKTWSATELAPYKTLIGKGDADLVMVGHLYNNGYGAPPDPEQLPASLSSYWIDGVLRDKLGYHGTVISDDLDMGAVRDLFKGEGEAGIVRQTVVKAVNAGIDILLFSNTAAYDPDLGPKVQAILVDEAKRDPAFEKRIEASYGRIAALKGQLKG